MNPKKNSFIYANWDELVEYEIKSAKAIYIKKERMMEKEEIIIFLNKKGYLRETIKQLGDDNE